MIAIKDQMDPGMVSNDVPHVWIRLGAAGTAIDRLRAEKVEELVMAGRINRPALSSLKPDAWATKFFAKAGLKALGDDGLLKTLVQELENEGFRVVGPETVMTDLLAPAGLYGAVQPDRQAEADIERGIEVARGLGGLDVGQAVVVQQGLVLAVEAIEGTDAMLNRAAGLRRDGPGGVLVKIKKPGQEVRADLPTIGTETVERAFQAGLRGIAVQAGNALIVDRSDVIRLADEKKLFLIGITIRGS